MKKHYQHLALIGMFLASLCGEAHARTEAKQLTDSERPIADALTLFEKRYSIPIDFEDVAPTAAVTSQDRLISKNWSVMVSDEVTPKNSLEDRHRVAGELITQLLRQYKEAGGIADYRLIDRKDRFEVRPVEGQDPNLLDVPINIEPKPRTAYEFVEALGDAIQNVTGVKVGVSAPTNLFMGHHTTLGAKNETARSVLARLFKEIPIVYPRDVSEGPNEVDIRTTYSWKLFYSTATWCWLDIAGVAPEGQGISDEAAAGPTVQDQNQ